MPTLFQDDLVAVGPQLADRLVDDGPDDGVGGASPSADAGAPAVSVVKKKLFSYDTF